MFRLFVLKNDECGCFAGRTLINLCALLLCSAMASSGQSTAPALNPNTGFSARASHLMGLNNIKNNCKGTLSIQDNVLRFQQRGKVISQVDISSIRNAFLGEESQQVGGLPMNIGKTAAPYGGGRVVSLFAHKKCDTLTLEYVDGHGGFHGAIFQLEKGQGELVRHELVAKGVYDKSGDQLTKENTSEVTHEDE